MHAPRARVVLLTINGLVLVAGLFALRALAAAAPEDSAPLTQLTASPTVAALTPTAEATAPSTPSPEPTPLTLEERVDLLLADPALAGVLHSLSIQDQQGHVIVDRAGMNALLPASTIKLVTAAAALGTLGPDFRYATHVRASSGPDAEGTVLSDLVLVGSGDPTLTTATFREKVSPQRPATALETLADQLVAAGVRRITGAVVGDATVFAHQPQAAGWRARYFDELDATYSSGLTIDGGQKLFVDNGKLQAVASADPTSEAAAALYTALKKRGVQIDGGVTTAAQPRGEALTLASVQSPALNELLQYMVQRSDNHLADAIFRTIGAIKGDSSWAGSARAVQGALQPLGLDARGLQMADGSGLSRENLVSASYLATLDAVLSNRSAHAARWASWQAVAGESGTMKRRLRGTIAEHRLRGKTGSLEDVRAIVGSISGPDGRRMHFALLSNQLPRVARDAQRTLQDQLILLLAGYLHNCASANGVVVLEAPPCAA